jgi:hypothetical protein
MKFNGMTTVVIAGALSFGTIAAANAETHRHASANHIRLASLADSYYGDRSWGSGGSQGWQGSSWQGSGWEGTTVRAVHRGHIRVTERHPRSRSGLGDLTSILRAKVSEIISACGSRLISGYRPGARVAGSGHASLHSVYPARAADLSGNPSCIYSHLHGWPGGYSVDYGRVRHVHVSYSPPGSGYLSGREWHARFSHFGGGYHRYAHHRRYAFR